MRIQILLKKDSGNRLYTVNRPGALAQLGERRLCKPEVAGSIPARSIKKPAGNGGFLSSGGLQVVQDGRVWKPFWKPCAADPRKLPQGLSHLALINAAATIAGAAA
jgi:hypothetical protein